MKSKFFLLTIAVVFLTATSVLALDFGHNITIYDGSSSEEMSPSSLLIRVDEKPARFAALEKLDLAFSMENICGTLSPCSSGSPAVRASAERGLL